MPEENQKYLTQEAQQLQDIIQKEIMPEIEKQGGEDYFKVFYSIEKIFSRGKIFTEEQRKKSKIGYVIKIACSRLSMKKSKEKTFESPTVKQIHEERKYLPITQQPLDATILISIERGEIDQQRQSYSFKIEKQIYDQIKLYNDLPLIENFIEEELKKSIEN